jgi:DNA-binding NarL/FixJ family response regulator
MTPLRVILGEDSYLAREGITRLLEESDGIDLVETCGDFDALREAIDRLTPDAVLTDIRMPPTHTDEGIRLAAELRRTHPEIGVVVLSQHAEVVYAMTLFKEGSQRRAYLLKERIREEGELGRALREVANGGSLVDPRIVDELFAALALNVESPLAKLTSREREILAMVAEGRSNSAIAESLVITKRAVERHINAIFAKLELGESEQVSRRVKAALMYLAGQAA